MADWKLDLLTQSKPEGSRRDQHQKESGFQVQDRGNTQFFPTPGVGKTKTPSQGPALPILGAETLSHVPTLKDWIGNRKGEARNPEEAEVVRRIKTLQERGVPLNLNVTSQGQYDMLFSGASGNKVDLDVFVELEQSGFSFGETLFITKMVCGPNGRCAVTRPCDVCQELAAGLFDGQPSRLVSQAASQQSLENSFEEDSEFGEELRSILNEPDYVLIENRVLNTGSGNAIELESLRELHHSLNKSVKYALELSGVYRDPAAASHNALKRADLGGV